MEIKRVIEGKEVRGHKLKELWNEINSCHAQKIMDELKLVTELEQDDILKSIDNNNKKEELKLIIKKMLNV